MSPLSSCMLTRGAHASSQRAAQRPGPGHDHRRRGRPERRQGAKGVLLDARRSGKVVVRKAGVGAAGLDELVIAQIVPTCFESILKAVGRQKISWTYSRGTSAPARAHTGLSRSAMWGRVRHSAAGPPSAPVVEVYPAIRPALSRALSLSRYLAGRNVSAGRQRGLVFQHR